MKPIENTDHYSLRRLALYFLKLGAIGFGGPVALIGHMQDDLVSNRKWYSLEEYKEGLTLAQLAPGPLAAQLAIYLGWLKGRAWGAALVGFAFILPSFVIVLLISQLYIRFNGLPFMRGLFYGIGAAVIAIISVSAWKLTRKTLLKDKALWGIALVSALTTLITESESLWVFILGGVIFTLIRKPVQMPQSKTLNSFIPAYLLIGLNGQADTSVLHQILFYFFTAGSVVFGSGLAVVPFLHGGVVDQFHWLTENQFIDAVAVAMITPGPVVITVAFIGYLKAGFMGALMAAIGVFMPCYLVVVILAPHYRKIVKFERIKFFITGVTAAAVGAIVGAVFVLGRRAIFDKVTIIIAALTLLCLLKVKKFPEPVLVLLAGAVGIILFPS